jgi:hypothetical protein
MEFCYHRRRHRQSPQHVHVISKCGTGEHLVVEVVQNDARTKERPSSLWKEWEQPALLL